MKLSKVLLSAVIAGVAITSASSCSKKCHDVDPAQTQTNPETTKPQGQAHIPDNCPACGMG